MSHSLESMFYAGAVPWHGLGTRVPAEVASSEVDQLAGLNWRVELKEIEAEGRVIPGYRAVVRDRDAKTLGIVSDIYQPIQNETVREVCDAIVGQGGAYYHTAGALNGGEDVWYLLRLPTSLKLGLDVTEDYLLATSNHCAKRKLRVMPTKIRVVCQNTLNLALQAGGADGIAISHYGDAAQRLASATKVLKASDSYSIGFNTMAQRLFAYRYTETQMKQLAAALFPSKAETAEEPSEPHWLTTRNRETVEGLFEGGKGHAQIAGTAWAALNAVAEFTDWQRGKDEARTASAWFGDGRRMKQRAFAVIKAQVDGSFRPAQKTLAA